MRILILIAGLSASLLFAQEVKVTIFTLTDKSVVRASRFILLDDTYHVVTLDGKKVQIKKADVVERDQTVTTIASLSGEEREKQIVAQGVREENERKQSAAEISAIDKELKDSLESLNTKKKALQVRLSLAASIERDIPPKLETLGKQLREADERMSKALDVHRKTHQGNIDVMNKMREEMNEKLAKARGETHACSRDLQLVELSIEEVKAMQANDADVLEQIRTQRKALLDNPLR